MKTKGITIWEKHAEKMVLGLAVAAAGFLIARQFIGEPNAVQVAGGRNVAPGEIDAMLSEEAERYRVKLEDRAPGLNLPEPRLAFEALDRGLGGGIAPDQSLDLAVAWVGPSADIIGPQQATEFAVPVLKAPTDLQVSQFADALTDAALDETPELKKRFPDPQQPADLKYVTVFGHFDVADLRAQFREGNGTIPLNWYQDRPETIIDVVVRRQEFVDGAWINETVLEQIPGRVTFRPRLLGEVSGVARETILKELGSPGVQTQVIQPEFYETRNDAWELPSLAVEVTEPGVAGGVETEADRLNRDLASRRSQRERDVKNLKDDYNVEYGEKSNEPPPEDEKGNDPAKGKDKEKGGTGRAPPGQGGGNFGVGGAGGGKRNAMDDEKAKKARLAIERVKGNIAKLDKEIAALEEKLTKLGAAVAAPEQAAAGGFDLGKDSEVWIWAHDINVTPGHTYRYAMAVRAYNPFFGRKRSLIEKQQALADAFTLDSPESQWSAATEIKPFYSFFVTDAYPHGQGSGPLGMGRATVEVHRFSDGQWWMETFSVQPGDSIGGLKPVKVGDEERQIDFSTGVMLVDVIEDIEAPSGGPGAGKNSQVLLQDIATGEVLAMRDPVIDSARPERRELKALEAERVASRGP